MLYQTHVKAYPVADLGEGPWAPILVDYLQKIYKKTTEKSIQRPF